MNLPLVVAGCLAIAGVAIHGLAGELLVVRKLSSSTLPSTSFGGPRMTRTMVHVAWHLTTVAFATVGVALLLSGTVLDGEAARALALLAAGASTAFVLVVLGLSAAALRPRSLITHPAPVLLSLTAALAWVGAL